MLSYRHGFHAGNHADVLKHLVLVDCLSRLVVKDTPLLYVDTHAGAGSYQLREGYAAMNEEWASGIERLKSFAANRGASAGGRRIPDGDPRRSARWRHHCRADVPRLARARRGPAQAAGQAGPLRAAPERQRASRVRCSPATGASTSGRRTDSPLGRRCCRRRRAGPSCSSTHRTNWRPTTTWSSRPSQRLSDASRRGYTRSGIRSSSATRPGGCLPGCSAWPRPESPSRSRRSTSACGYVRACPENEACQVRECSYSIRHGSSGKRSSLPCPTWRKRLERTKAHARASSATDWIRAGLGRNEKPRLARMKARRGRSSSRRSASPVEASPEASLPAQDQTTPMLPSTMATTQVADRDYHGDHADVGVALPCG